MVFLGKAMGGRPRPLAAVCPEKPLVHLSTRLLVPRFDHEGDSICQRVNDLSVATQTDVLGQVV